jgi:hypothetical protein
MFSNIEVCGGEAVLLCSAFGLEDTESLHQPVGLLQVLGHVVLDMHTLKCNSRMSDSNGSLNKITQKVKDQVCQFSLKGCVCLSSSNNFFRLQ